MEWKHRRDRTKAEMKKTETKAGTNYWFMAAAIAVA